MALLITDHRKGFPFGETVITEIHEKEHDTGIAFSIVKLKKGESFDFASDKETALLLLEGEGEFTADELSRIGKRHSLFDERPFVVHAPSHCQLQVEAHENLEIARFSVLNPDPFPIRIFSPEEVEDEHRGKGLVDDASLRFVRTVFDGSNSDPNTQLVLGEVINFPGKWSSYPPHHHPQPEIYHYRFTHPQGYGHAELGEEVFKVRSYDTLKILDERDHSQCAAPGYGMYYSWVIRHLEGNRYTVPEFTENHRWTMDKEAISWHPE